MYLFIRQTDRLPRSGHRDSWFTVSGHSGRDFGMCALNRGCVRSVCANVCALWNSKKSATMRVLEMCAVCAHLFWSKFDLKNKRGMSIRSVNELEKANTQRTQRTHLRKSLITLTIVCARIGLWSAHTFFKVRTHLFSRRARVIVAEPQHRGPWTVNRGPCIPHVESKRTNIDM